MKTVTRILFVFLITNLFSSNTFAQNYIPFPDSNATWVNGYYDVQWNNGPYPNQPDIVLSQVDNYCVNGEDTIINGLNYSKLFICDVSYFGAIRDDNGKVYFVQQNDTTPYLMYDFTVNTGDTATYYILGTTNAFSEVVYVDSILINGNYRKRINLQGSGYWIEGIGCSFGLFRETI